MEFDSFVRPVWQLPALEQVGVPTPAKYHCFVDGKSLCGKYTQVTDAYDEGITVESSVVLQIPQTVCKRCYKMWLRLCLPEELAQREEGQDG